MKIEHYKLSFPPLKRGMHLITDDIVHQLPKLPSYGVFKLFIQHTSCAITINENADPSVRADFENYLDRLVPENTPFFTHTYEGPDDMPAHIKASLIGYQLEVPIIDGELALGTWQGIYLCEFRNQATARRLIATIISE